jgi:hypothetical protein
MVICYKGKNRTFGKVSNETVSLPNASEKPYFSYLSPLRTVNLILHIPWGKPEFKEYLDANLWRLHWLYEKMTIISEAILQRRKMMDFPSSPGGHRRGG